MKYAQIKDGIVKNIIVLDDVSLLPLFLEGFDFIIEVSEEPGSPGRRWGYTEQDGFTPPVI